MGPFHRPFRPAAQEPARGRLRIAVLSSAPPFGRCIRPFATRYDRSRTWLPGNPFSPLE